MQDDGDTGKVQRFHLHLWKLQTKTETGQAAQVQQAMDGNEVKRKGTVQEGRMLNQAGQEAGAWMSPLTSSAELELFDQADS